MGLQCCGTGNEVLLGCTCTGCGYCCCTADAEPDVCWTRAPCNPAPLVLLLSMPAPAASMNSGRRPLDDVVVVAVVVAVVILPCGDRTGVVWMGGRAGEGTCRGYIVDTRGISVRCRQQCEASINQKSSTTSTLSLSAMATHARQHRLPVETAPAHVPALCIRPGRLIVMLN
jgi:hypothetical protein